MTLREETQASVTAWADETFGPVNSNLSIALRAAKEMVELIKALIEQDDNPTAAQEIADIVIVLYRLSERLEIDLAYEIDTKMAINRERTWVLDGDGHGQHVKDDKL